MTREQYLLLYEKYLAGEATPEEADNVLLYQDEFEMYVPTKEEYWDNANIETGNRILNKLNQSTGNEPVPKVYSWRWLSTAAAVLVISVAGVLFLKNKLPVNTQTDILAVKHVIAPGSNKATLTLPNGKVISLNEPANGTITKQGNIMVKKKKYGMLEYVVLPAVTDHMQAPVINTITTPRGGQYTVTLSDGTIVMLDAASSIKFPVSFTGNERKVEITGQVYFEVIYNKSKPFHVLVNGQDIKDLGTHFNIKAYEDEPYITTTLIEGKLSISNNTASKILNPGQEAVIKPGEKSITIKSADVEESVAWKNGLFIFHQENLKDIMRTISRWYDVDIEYNGTKPLRKLGGTISKYKNINELLDNFKITSGIKYTIEGRRVILTN